MSLRTNSSRWKSGRRDYKSPVFVPRKELKTWTINLTGGIATEGSGSEPGQCPGWLIGISIVLDASVGASSLESPEALNCSSFGDD